LDQIGAGEASAPIQGARAGCRRSPLRAAVSSLRPEFREWLMEAKGVSAALFQYCRVAVKGWRARGMRRQVPPGAKARHSSQRSETDENADNNERSPHVVAQGVTFRCCKPANPARCRICGSGLRNQGQSSPLLGQLHLVQGGISQRLENPVPTIRKRDGVFVLMRACSGACASGVNHFKAREIRLPAISAKKPIRLDLIWQRRRENSPECRMRYADRQAP
jgi:hypothetical protein